MAFEAKISEIENVNRATLADRQGEGALVEDLDIVVSADLEHHAGISKEILSLPGIADVKGAFGDSKISLILDTSLFMEEFSVGHIDKKRVLDAIGGAEYEQLESGDGCSN